MIAVGCNGMNPCIYMYSFPAMTVTKVLKLGTERGYASLDFSPDGNLLSSVGQSPDFLLTVWDWAEERITLHTKAFGQDVYNVAFSKEEGAGRLTTSGTGHIRFWNMAKTFTGLKLQGEIGKFGKIDLSDIEAFVELPDSKVVSSSESGHLLLWEGNFVKCRLVTSSSTPDLMYEKAGEDLIFGDVPAHKGGVYSIVHDRELDMIISAGADGNIKFWSFNDIDVAEVDSDITMDYPIMPKKTIPLGPDVSIKHVVDSGDSYFVEDANGALYRQSKTATSADTRESLWTFHSGSIVGIAASPVDHYCATAGSDGNVFIWDYVNKTVVASHKNNHGCTSITVPPVTVDKTGKTFTVGFEDGVMRCFTFDGDSLTLKQVTKPHNGPVTVISYSPDGKYVATGGRDGVCFVIKCPDPSDPSGSYTPIGFVTSEDEAPITSLSWKEDSTALLYSFANTMVEMAVSDGISAISANSFEMEPKTTTYKYKDRPVMKDTSEEDTEEKKGDDKADEPAEIVNPPICYACYKTGDDKDNFLVGLGAEKAGKIFEGKFGDEYSLGEYHSGVATHNVDIHDIAKVKQICYSSSKKFVVTTFDDGSVTVRPNEELGFFTKYTIHESSSGGSSGAALSFDDEFLLSVGFDGLLAIHRLNPQGVTDAAVKAKGGAKIEETLPDSLFNFEDSGEGSSIPPEGFQEVFSSSKEGQEKAAAAAAAAVEDITDDAAYSIQDEKLRKEEDARKLAAEKKKDSVREVIIAMQKEYSDLVKKNTKLPIELQLTAEELRVDPEYDEILAEQGRHMIEEVQLECAHESEKSFIRLSKLQKEFIEVLEWEPFCVHGMKNNLAVPSFPTRKLSPELQDLLDLTHSVMDGESGGNSRGTTFSGGSGSSRRTQRASRATKQRITIADLGLDDEGNEKKLTMPEKRKMMRMQRQQAMDELTEMKPADDADDPRDVKAIEAAIKNLGDYKIKTAEGYEVPEEQQVNADRKMRQLVLLIESVYNIQVKFNKRLTAARDAKCETYQSVKACNERIRNIDKQLGQSQLSKDLWEPKLMSSEYPEDRSFFTQEDVDAFLKSAASADGDVSKAVCPMAAVPSKSLRAVGKETTVNAGGSEWDEEALKLASSLPILRATFDSETHGEMPVYEEESTLSQMEKDEMSETRKKLTFQRATLVDKIESDVKSVDDQISMLRKDRLVFATELKAAELRMLVLSKELKLLQDFEAKDKMLTNKLEKCQRDKAEVVASISDCHGRLETKGVDLEEWTAKEHEIMEEFKKIVPESNGFYEQLLKIFKRKIKRKKVRNNDDDDDEMDSEEEDDDDYDSDDDDDDDEEEVDDSCPPGCDTHLYETIIALREKRLDQEETLNEFQKELDDLKKAHDRHIGRERQIDKDLKSTEVEILRFQTEKQKEINELLVAVPLKIGQIKLWKKDVDSEGNDVEVPENPVFLRDSVKIDECAIFSEATMEKLKARIGELKEEIVVDKANFGGLHKEKRALEKDKLAREKEIAQKEKECEEIQMLKFGQIIDIGELDKISVNNDEAELKKKSKTLEISNEKEVFAMQGKSRKLKEKLLQLTNINTEKLNNIASLNGRQFFLEKELNGKGGGMQVADDGPTVRQETEERNRLVALVKLQAKEVDALKAEINLLRRKGGHIYAPPPPPELIAGGDVMAMDAPDAEMGGEAFQEEAV